MSKDGHTRTNPQHPGPFIGQTSGFGVGYIGGTALSACVGFIEGAYAGVKSPFTNETYGIQTYRTETTPDGRKITIPCYTATDTLGRKI